MLKRLMILMTLLVFFVGCSQNDPVVNDSDKSSEQNTTETESVEKDEEKENESQSQHEDKEDNQDGDIPKPGDPDFIGPLKPEK